MTFLDFGALSFSLVSSSVSFVDSFFINKAFNNLTISTMMKMSKLLTNLTSKEMKFYKLMIWSYSIQPQPFVLTDLQDHITNQELVILIVSSFSLKVEDGVMDSIRKVLLKIASADQNGISEHHLSNFILVPSVFKTIFSQNIQTITSGTGKRYF